jgi:ubiquinone/menaquinone biosynthesis C-methylase UbiE
MFFRSMKNLVQKNSLLWGEEVAEDYHGAAARDMQAHWNDYIEPTIRRHPITYTNTIDFACGYGRNTDFLLPLADHVTMIDVNKHNVEYCQKKYADNPKVTVNECNGYDLSNIGDGECSFFYTFDSMVHFPQEIVKAYLPEFFRVLAPGGYAFIHHSNYVAGGPKKDFRKNPHWRNYMSAAIFADIATSAGFSVAEQTLHHWGVPDLDCVSVIKKS